MSSYREHSFDPNAWEPQGPPARPYNKVQWIGAAFGGLAVVAFLVDVAGQLGWVPHYFGEDSTWIVVLCGCMAVLLVNSRRAPAPPEYRERFRRRGRILAAVTIAAAILGAAVVIILKSKAAI